ncbi:hypothetical protein K7H22_15325 [Seohaeicola saemankumensis]|uniref:hypothetical protein n=1 Tax=Seohaeicola saemankumensis TaxID=481181 RepID=UPI001E5C1C94|nr:hypothetical protein [Seohaeicola saemankumensis]MCD1627372.1 hypothetical protein [Seohaeicola saemankumensis]
MTRILLSVVSTLSLAITFGGAGSQRAYAEPLPLTTKVIQSGHSLTDPVFEPLRAMVAASGNRGVVMTRSTIPGSPMDWRWNNESGNGPDDARKDIGKYELLVITERVALSGTFPWHNSPDEALRWFNHAWTDGNGRNGAETILYATWVDINSGPDAENPYNDPDGNIPFRERLPREMGMWEQIQDHVNANRPDGSPPMRMIPGPLLMAAMYDAIKAGEAPGLTDISDLFLDAIHVNDLGAYFIALAHFAVIYERDPRGLPNRLGMPTSPTREQAEWMQELVWKVVTEYEGTGVSGS